MENQDQNNEIVVITSEIGAVRGGAAAKLKVEELAMSVTVFLGQMDAILAKSPARLGKFEFAEFEVHAEVTAKGSLALLGTGGEAGATGGLKFVFRRGSSK